MGALAGFVDTGRDTVTTVAFVAAAGEKVFTTVAEEGVVEGAIDGLVVTTVVEVSVGVSVGVTVTVSELELPPELSELPEPPPELSEPPPELPPELSGIDVNARIGRTRTVEVLLVAKLWEPKRRLWNQALSVSVVY
jgi:hypothetical protein